MTNILIDHQQLAGDGGGIEKALYGFSVEQAYLDYRAQGGKPLQMAFVARELNDYNPALEISRTITDLKIELFGDTVDAIAWLEQS